ncbi:heavy metal translocating P-type ATPase, partial [bacterium]|nr:heavy metal translocating P-type ATPase [bacterium]
MKRPSKSLLISAFALVAIISHVVMFYAFGLKGNVANIPLLLTLTLGGIPLVYDLFRKMFKREFGSDLLAGVSIVTSVLLEEYLAGSIVVLMLSGGEAIESYAMAKASSVLRALANRMPLMA